MDDEQKDGLLIGLIVTVTFLLIFGSPFGRAQVSDQMLFRLCWPVPYVRVEVFLQETGASRVLTEESIASLAERRLRVEGMYFDEREEGMPHKRYVPSVRLSVLKHEQAYNTQVAFRRELREWDENKWMRHAVWSVENVGLADDANLILDSLSRQLEVFLDEYALTNSSLECKQHYAQLFAQQPAEE